MLYFDNSATTMPDQSVLDTYLQVSKEYFANPSSLHELGVKSKKLLEQAREQVAEILQVKTNEVYFTSSGTEANNWVLQAVVRELSKHRPNAKRILVSAIEHPSVYEQINLLLSENYRIERISVNPQGEIDLPALKDQLDSDVLLISTMAVNNEVGAVQPLEQIAELLAEHPQIIWHVDAVQAVTTQLSLLHNSRIDAMTLSGHKFHAGRGTGILTLKQKVNTQPFIYGGGQEKGLRSSTENLASIVATAKALRLASTKQEAVKQNLAQFRRSLIEAFKSQNWQVFAEASASEHILCVAYPSIPGEVLVHAFETEGVMISTTSACSSRKHQVHSTLKAMGVPDNISESAVRLSMSSLTTSTQVNELIKIIEKVTAKFA